eukprot:gene12575-26481_t
MFRILWGQSDELFAGAMYLQSRGKITQCFCCYCMRDITKIPRVRCAVCQPDIDFCADCFAAGVNINDHKNYHGYFVVDCIEQPIFSKDWTISEELLLLEGIDKFGAGNWKTVSDYVGSKTTRQCDEHYWEVYLGVYGHCLPPKTILNDLVTDTSSIVSANPVLLELDEIPVCNSHYSGEVIVRDRGKESSRSKDKNELRDRLCQLPGAELPGYMPLRQDFDVEHDNDAEVVLADMDMGGEDGPSGVPDHPSERELKLQVIRIYNLKLDERERRKRFVIDQGLVDFRKQQQTERRRSREERDLVARLKLFSRFQSAKDQDILIQGLLKARRLHRQISLYQSYRALGLRSMDACRQHETERRRRDTEAKARKQRDREGITPSIGGNVTSTSSQHGPASRGRPGRGVVADETPLLPSQKTYVSRCSSSSNVSGRTAMQTMSEFMAVAPSSELLNGRELELCNDCEILPLHYLAAKEAVVREAYRNGSITSSSVRRILKVSSTGTTGILKPDVVDFFVRELTDAATCSVEVSPFLASLSARQRFESRQTLKHSSSSIDDGGSEDHTRTDLIHCESRDILGVTAQSNEQIHIVGSLADTSVSSVCDTEACQYPRDKKARIDLL